MTVTYVQLGEQQRCIYDAFTKATGLDGPHLGGIVNAAGEDADDTQAVLILGKKYGFVQTPRGCTGAKFKDILSNLDEKTEFIVLVCTGMGRSMVPATSAPNAGFSYSFETGLDATRLLTDAAFDGILWHAIYVSAGKGGSNTSVHDKQGKRPRGPVARDRIIWFAK